MREKKLSVPVKVLFITGLLVLLILGTVDNTKCQTVEKKEVKCDHTSNSWDRFVDNMRFTPALKLLDWNGRDLSTYYRGKTVDHYTTFTADADSNIHLDKNYKEGYYMILFCLKDYHIYAIYKKEFTK